MVHNSIIAYNQLQEEDYFLICEQLSTIIQSQLSGAESKIWHSHPVWFIEENPIVGYSKQKRGIRLMFWSGQDFDEPDLTIRGEKFKDASVFYTDVSQIDTVALVRWLQKAQIIQWDYKNIVKRKGKLERLK
ncbi:DUF1801 domain-containing protein [Flavobacterium sp. N1719]|uniref:DUF1801 domain-containing protein n=1 Tax=Flavobacterium sp. N1719 TaxID=2885633 RepID=UPI002222E0A3|nr:DUF1801 domain-containing protein [Flavobacterium sp. N1719]